MSYMKFIFIFVLTVFGTMTLATAQQYPNKSIRIIVPFPAGGTTDILARELGRSLEKKWAVPVMIENKGGASGTIGSLELVKSAPDGYTLMVTATHHVINPSIRKSMPYDTLRDFTPLALVGTVPNVLIANIEFPAKSVSDLITLAKARPGSISFASTGIGGANHLSGELFKAMTHTDMKHIPYKGEAPAMADLLGGHVPVMFAGIPSVERAIQTGKLKALGVTTLKRLPELPSVPTIDESGVRGFETLSWFGLYGPANLPVELTRKISEDINSVLRTSELKKQFEKVGTTPGELNQAAFVEFVKKELIKWSETAEFAKIEKQ